MKCMKRKDSYKDKTQIYMRQELQRRHTGLTLQNFTWIWSKFIVYTGSIYKSWNHGRAINEKKKKTLDTTEVLAKSIYMYVIY